MRGGYKLIDMKGLDIHADSTVKIEGIYDKIEGNYGKPLLFHGLLHNDIEMEDTWINMLAVPNLYLGSLIIREGSNTIQVIFSITDEDMVSVTRVTLGGN